MKPARITLTEGINREGQEQVAALAQQTYHGMAHFAGTGPSGQTCHECRFWARRDTSGRPPAGKSSKSAPCLKARQLSHGRCGSEIPHFAAACRHFEASEMKDKVKTSD